MRFGLVPLLRSRLIKWSSISLNKFSASVVIGMLICGAAAAAPAQATQYIVTNDDVPPQIGNSVSFYSVQPNGALSYQQKVVTSGFGIGGGYFGLDRVAVVGSGSNSCVYISEAGTGDIVGVVISSFTVGGRATGSSGDTGTSNGIGLATNGQYLYASFTDSSTIGTFQLESGCNLTFVGDTTVDGLQGGIIDAMAVHGTILIATYADGSMESFNIASGLPLSNGDKQNSTAYVSSTGATYPNSIDITQDGRFAIFGDTSTSVVAEVSDISSGHLGKTVAYTSNVSISSSNIMLSPDETLLYVVDTQGDSVSAAFFDKNTGVLSGGCTSGILKGYVANFSYLSGLAFASTTGTGGGIYVSEFGAPSGIAMIQVSSSGGKCTLREAPNSPVTDQNSSGLLSIGSVPPRPF